jgi:hypothetical protein
MRSTLYITGVLTIMLILAAAPAFAAGDTPGVPRPPLVKYVAVYAGQMTVGGEFDGATTVSHVQGVFSLPDVNAGTGFGLAAGARSGWGGIEVAYWYSSHTSRWDGISNDGHKHMISVDGRIHPWRLGRLRPYASVGTFLDWLTVANGYCSDNHGEICDERFGGFGLSFGGGADFYLSDRLFVRGHLAYRETEYDTIKSPESGDSPLSASFSGSGLTWATGLAFEF